LPKFSLRVTPDICSDDDDFLVVGVKNADAPGAVDKQKNARTDDESFMIKFICIDYSYRAIQEKLRRGRRRRRRK